MTAIALDRVTLSIAGNTILSDISLDVGEGEFVGVLGANGSGKTTLMKAILGLLPLRSGTIRVLGQPATRGNPAIGYLPQSHAAPPGLRLSGRDILAASIRGHRLGCRSSRPPTRKPSTGASTWSAPGSLPAAPSPTCRAASASAC